jgi:hypothetical protein
VSSSISHLWSNHLKAKVKALVYTKAQSDAKFVGQNGVAADSDKLDGMDAADFSEPGEFTNLVGSDPAFNDGSNYSPGANPFEGCYWRNFDDLGHSVAKFFKDDAGVVHLSGVVQAVDGSVAGCSAGSPPDFFIFQLPEGYRPTQRVDLLSLANNDVAKVNINSSGGVAVDSSHISAAEAWLTLDSLTFRAESP